MDELGKKKMAHDAALRVNLFKSNIEGALLIRSTVPDVEIISPGLATRSILANWL